MATPKPPGSNLARFSAISCPSPTLCEAVGYYADGQGIYWSFAERWDGSTWSVQQVPRPHGASLSVLFGLTCLSATECTAVGEYDGFRWTRPLIEHWDGSTWSVSRSPNPSDLHAPISTLWSVSCLNAGDCVAVGNSQNGRNYSRNLVEAWDGTTWSIVAVPNRRQAILDEISCTGSTCMAVGSFLDKSGLIEPQAERLVASRWVLQRPPIPDGAIDGQFLGVACFDANDCVGVGYSIADQRLFALAERYSG